MADTKYIAFYEPPEGKEFPMPGIIAGMRAFAEVIKGRAYAFSSPDDVDTVLNRLKAETEPGSAISVVEVANCAYAGKSGTLISGMHSLADALHGSKPIAAGSN
jgi:hypothetical protein